MRRAGKRRRQPGAAVAPRRIELGLGQEDAPGQVGAAQVGAPEVRSGQVSGGQVAAPQISPGEVRAPEAGAAQAGAAQVLSDEVGAPEISCLAPGSGSGPRQLAGPQEQGINVPPVRLDVQRRQHVGAAAGQSLGLRQRAAPGSPCSR